MDKSILHFLAKLQLHNDRSWFEAKRQDYENARAAFLISVEEMIRELGKFEPAIGNLQPKNCVFRINRDVRFSKDKRPYKNNMAAYFNKDGKAGEGAGYYMHIEPGKSFIGAGIWVPESKILQNIRQELDYNFPAFQKIISRSGLKKHFPAGITQTDKLLRPPKGYDAENPAIEFLKLKSFLFSKTYTDAELMDKSWVKSAAAAFKSLKSFIDFLNRALD